jgi:hypothetical protein
MDRLSLTNHLIAPLTKNWVNVLSAQLVREGFELTDLLELTLNKHQRTAFRAAWLLDTLVLSNFGSYAEHIDLFTKYGQQAPHHSCHRHYARIFMFLPPLRRPKQ